MTNLEDWVEGIESWGFRVVDYDEDTMFFEGIERDDDTMVTYRIAPGVFVDYINIKSRYRSENAAHSGRRGYRIAYCSSGNYYTHINGSKVLITSAEVFVGKAIPEAKASYGTQEGIVAFNIVVAPDEIEGRTFLADLSRDFVEAVKEVIYGEAKRCSGRSLRLNRRIGKSGSRRHWSHGLSTSLHHFQGASERQSQALFSRDGG